MFIVDQERRKVVNIDRVVDICLYANRIECNVAQYGEVTLGTYETTERAAEVFKQMLKDCFSPPMMVFRDEKEVRKAIERGFVSDSNLMIVTEDSMPRVEKIERSCWYMPRE